MTHTENQQWFLNVNSRVLKNALIKTHLNDEKRKA